MARSVCRGKVNYSRRRRALSLRRKVSHFLALVVVAALGIGLVAAPASAKVSAKQKAQIRAKLKKQVKKNPGVVKKRSFLKQASLVNFKLPVTVRLRTGDVPATPANEAATNNTNRATIDLGASLGQREVNLGGSLPAEISFKDSYDGGALGNVDLEILPSATKTLTSTSIPLLWNTQVSGAGTRYDANFLGLPSALSGCGNFTGSANLPFGADNVLPPIPIFGPAGLPGFPYHQASDPLVGSAGAPEGFLPVDPGVDNINNLAAAKDPGNPDSLGGNPSPFPSGSAPTGFTQPPSVKDTVLRTTPLSLGIAPAGTPVNQSTTANGVFGSQDVTIGKSGGQANLFGNIPGKGYGIDVTVSLATKINSILRIVDQDPFGTNLRVGDDWPAGIFNCRQVYSGAVQNYIPDVKLQGSLKISPAITSDGKLRIAKAALQTGTYDASRFAVAACLVPFASYNAPANGSDGDPQPSKIPAPTAFPAAEGTANLPSDVDNYRSGTDLDLVHNTSCNSTPTGLVKYSALAQATVDQLSGANNLADGFTVTNSGSVAAVAADLKVNNVSADILVGDA
jgi:hypothetical protein